MRLKTLRLTNVLAAALILLPAMALAQQPPAAGGQRGAAPAGGGGRGGGPRLMVTSTAWPDGGEIPMKHARGGENKSPAFEFVWIAPGGVTPTTPPEGLQSYAIIFHDIENASNRGPADTLHWSVFNIPGTAKGLPEGLGAGDLPDGTRNGPGIGAGRGGAAPSYFGPGAGPGSFHHYVFEFYALDAKLTLPATTTRDELMKAMEGHVIGKAAYVGRFRAPTP